jgi:predicted nucleic acid-binding protein
VIVLDSSFLIGYHNTRDVHHTAADQVMTGLVAGRWGRALLLEYVFLEIATVLLARRGLRVAAAVTAALLASREIDFVPCSDLFLEVFGTFRDQRDPLLSFTDAAIVTVARRHGGAFVATFDDDFTRLDGVTVVPG